MTVMTVTLEAPTCLWFIVKQSSGTFDVYNIEPEVDHFLNIYTHLPLNARVTVSY